MGLRGLRRFSEGYYKDSLQLRLAGGGRSHERTLLRPDSLLTGKNTGIFAIFGRTNSAVIPVTDLYCQTSETESQFGIESNSESSETYQGI
jgi:hypothetical protein